MFPIILIILAAVGLTISSYFTAVAYGWIDPTEKWIPSFCRMGEQTCSRVIHSPRARVFGLPNSLLGQLFYLAILAATFANLIFLKPYSWLFLSASFLTVLLGIYLSYSLLYLTRIRCVLCFTSHAINGVIFLILFAGRSLTVFAGSYHSSSCGILAADDIPVRK